MMTLRTGFKQQNCASDNKIGPNEEEDMSIKEVAFFGGLDESRPIRANLKTSKNSDWLEKLGPPNKPLLAFLYDQNKSGFFGGPAFFQSIRAV